MLRIWRRFLLFVSRWFQIESLYKFNAKFCPAWVPRFFVFPGPGDASRVGVAALEAEAFLVWPRLELRRLARRLGLARARRRLGRVLPAHPASAARRPLQPASPGNPARPPLACRRWALGTGRCARSGVALGNDPLAA